MRSLGEKCTLNVSGLQVSPGSRYIHLAWAMFEKLEGNEQNARELLARGHELNPNDAAILQVRDLLGSPNAAPLHESSNASQNGK